MTTKDGGIDTLFEFGSFKDAKKQIIKAFKGRERGPCGKYAEEEIA